MLSASIDRFVLFHGSCVDSNGRALKAVQQARQASVADIEVKSVTERPDLLDGRYEAPALYKVVGDALEDRPVAGDVPSIQAFLATLLPAAVLQAPQAMGVSA